MKSSQFLDQQIYDSFPDFDLNLTGQSLDCSQRLTNHNQLYNYSHPCAILINATTATTSTSTNSGTSATAADQLARKKSLTNKKYILVPQISENWGILQQQQKWPKLFDVKRGCDFGVYLLRPGSVLNYSERSGKTVIQEGAVLCQGLSVVYVVEVNNIFTVNIKVLNRPSRMHRTEHCYSLGTYGRLVEIEHSCSDKNILAKKISLPDQNTQYLKKLNQRQKQFQQALTEVAFSKIACVLGVGPEVYTGFGFDMVHYSDGVQFFLQKAEANYTELSEFNRLQLQKDIQTRISVLHYFGLIHKDIKPTNIVYSREKGYLLIDFGVSQAVKQQPHQESQTYREGTLRFMSPQLEKLQKKGSVNLYKNDQHCFMRTLEQISKNGQTRQPRNKNRTAQGNKSKISYDFLASTHSLFFQTQNSNQPSELISLVDKFRQYKADLPLASHANKFPRKPAKDENAYQLSEILQIPPYFLNCETTKSDEKSLFHICFLSLEAIRKQHCIVTGDDQCEIVSSMYTNMLRNLKLIFLAIPRIVLTEHAQLLKEQLQKYLQSKDTTTTATLLNVLILYYNLLVFLERIDQAAAILKKTGSYIKYKNYPQLVLVYMLHFHLCELQGNKEESRYYRSQTVYHICLNNSVSINFWGGQLFIIPEYDFDVFMMESAASKMIQLKPVEKMKWESGFVLDPYRDFPAFLKHIQQEPEYSMQWYSIKYCLTKITNRTQQIFRDPTQRKYAMSQLRRVAISNLDITDQTHFIVHAIQLQELLEMQDQTLKSDILIRMFRYLEVKQSQQSQEQSALEEKAKGGLGIELITKLLKALHKDRDCMLWNNLDLFAKMLKLMTVVQLHSLAHFQLYCKVALHHQYLLKPKMLVKRTGMPVSSRLYMRASQDIKKLREIQPELIANFFPDFSKGEKDDQDIEQFKNGKLGRDYPEIVQFLKLYNSLKPNIQEGLKMWNMTEPYKFDALCWVKRYKKLSYYNQEKTLAYPQPNLCFRY